MKILSNNVLVEFLPEENLIVSGNIIVVSSLNEDSKKAAQKPYINKVIKLGPEADFGNDIVKEGDIIICERNTGLRVKLELIKELKLDEEKQYYLYRDVHIIAKYTEFESKLSEISGELLKEFKHGILEFKHKGDKDEL